MVVGKERDRIPGFRWRWCRIASSGSNTVGLLLLFKMIKKAFLSSASCFNSCLVFQTLLWVPSVSKVVQPVGERRNSEILVLLFWSSSNKTLSRRRCDFNNSIDNIIYYIFHIKCLRYVNHFEISETFCIFGMKVLGVWYLRFDTFKRHDFFQSFASIGRVDLVFEDKREENYYNRKLLASYSYQVACKLLAERSRLVASWQQVGSLLVARNFLTWLQQTNNKQ